MGKADSSEIHNFKELAFDAIKTIPDSGSSLFSEFLNYIDKNQFPPIAQVEGIPIYRLEDFKSNSVCYMSNERAIVTTIAFSSVEFSLFGAYLAFTGAPSKSEVKQESYITPQDIINVAMKAERKKRLTPAELRLASQLIAGITLKSAAINDNVSLETKRSQSKAIMAKLGVGRQQDVVRVLLPHLVKLTNPESWDKHNQKLFNRYAEEFLPKDARCQQLTDTTGRSVRIVDYGPLRGKPVLILHSMIFPDITTADIEFAFKHGLRLIWPLRPGILEGNSTAKDIREYAIETQQGIELAWEHMCGEAVPVIAMVSSAWHATAFAEKHPDKVTDISFAATCFSAGKYENSLTYFGSSVAELCSRNVWLMTKTVDFIRNNVSELARFKTTILRVFKSSQPDMKILNQEFNGFNQGERIKSVLVDSPESVKHDYFSQVHFRWETISQLQMPVKFIHGAEDSIHKLKDVERLVKIIGKVPLTAIEHTGHIMQYEHFHSLLTSSLNLSSCEDSLAPVPKGTLA